MVWNIAIVEDSHQDANLLREYFARYCKERDVEFNIAHFSSGEQFLDKYRPVYDAVFMDICLAKVNGMDAAALLRRLDKTVLLVFVTNMAQFAVRGYEVEAFDFIVKPVAYANFALKLQRLINRLRLQQGGELVVTSGNRIYRIPTAQLKYIEITSHLLVYHTASGNIEGYGNLKEVEASLNPKVFIRCNSCYLVNLKYVRDVKGFIANVGGDELKISRPKHKAFIQALNDYLGGGV